MTAQHCLYVEQFRSSEPAIAETRIRSRSKRYFQPVASGSTRMAVVLLVWIRNNMTSNPELTASLIVHKQAEFTRQYSRLRSYSFSATVADRFFSDNSLNRQKRVVDCTKRRQARAQEKARLQSEQLHQFQEQHERKAQERIRRDARESLRLTRKLEHVAAAYIQYVWRKTRRDRAFRHRTEEAARFIADFMSFRVLYRKWWRVLASRSIQRAWRVYSMRKTKARSFQVLQRLLGWLVWRQRRKKSSFARRIQCWFRHCRSRKRRLAAKMIQRMWRVTLLRRRLERNWNERRVSKLHDQSARVLQLALGRYAVSQRLLRSEAFAHYEELVVTMRHDSNAVIPADEERQQTQQALALAVSVGKQITSMEALLLKQVDELEARLKEATKRQNNENERLRRLHRWLELRYSKEDDHLRAQLEEWEARKRHEIRVELERAVEIERRARLRDKQTPLKRMSDGALILCDVCKPHGSTI